jgi:hypothetical protein
MNIKTRLITIELTALFLVVAVSPCCAQQKVEKK